MGAVGGEPSAAGVRLRQNPGFVRFWLASTVSDFGTYITTLAVSVLILVTMDGTALDQGLVNAARWAPYLLFGLAAGIWVDRFSRRTVLIAGDLGRGLILTGICAAAAAGFLTAPWLMILMFAFGTLALTSDAAYQSFLPRLVPRPLLTRANARLQQSDTVAQTTGSAAAGGLVALVSAPFALLVDAASYLFSAVVLLTLKPEAKQKPEAKHKPGSELEPEAKQKPEARHKPGSEQEPDAGPGIGPDTQEGFFPRIAEGLRWVYGHPFLAPLALSSHVWFIGSAVLGAVLPTVVLKDLGMGPAGLGLVLGCAGVGAVIGTTVSTGLGLRWGTGRTIIAARTIQPAAIALVALAPLAAGGTGQGSSLPDWPAGTWWALALAGGGQLLFGMAMGLEGPLEMGYRQAVTPDRLLARMSATLRSANRGMIVVGAPLGGIIAAAAGTGAALWTSCGLLLLSAVVLVFSRFRDAGEGQHLTADESPGAYWRT
ncbi:MFS transporter [Arthrobacter sp. G119Y2]|uniref:MFS transporter n=1 Tax=Arthrobacter sp. G119Y2 TaxID=3134965 RepID=UPI00311A18E9